MTGPLNQAPAPSSSAPPILRNLLRGTFWLALRTPLQAIFTLWSVPLILDALGPDRAGAYYFAWGFGFLQFLLEFGMGSALQRHVSERWTCGDRTGIDRAVAFGTTFHTTMALVQAGVLLTIAYQALPQTGYRGASHHLIVQILWLQAATAPVYALMPVVASVLQAARRYEVIPRCQTATVMARFAVLVAGLAAGVDFFVIVVAQTIVQIGLELGPALLVLVRELGYVPRLAWVHRADFLALTQFSLFVFLIQLSIVLTDRLDMLVLGFALADPGPATAIYQVVSKPFYQIRQTGWLLAHLVMPAVASLAAARDQKGLERIQYDGPRLHFGLLLPVILLAGTYAAPFLSLWVGREFGRQVPQMAGLMRLFLVADLPLVLTIHSQMAFGTGRVRVIALANLAGALVNLPLSYFLTLRLGVAGVIWGTVLTTIVSTLLVPGWYLFRILNVRLGPFLSRTLAAPLAGAATLVLATSALAAVLPPEPPGSTSLTRLLLLLAHLTVGCLAYLAGYLAIPAGRSDLAALRARLPL